MATRFAAEGAEVVAGGWNAARLDDAVAAIRAGAGTAVGTPGNIDAAGSARAGDPRRAHRAFLALFLASDEPRHVNGAIVPHVAGWTAAQPASGRRPPGPASRPGPRDRIRLAKASRSSAHGGRTDPRTG